MEGSAELKRRFCRCLQRSQWRTPPTPQPPPAGRGSKAKAAREVPGSDCARRAELVFDLGVGEFAGGAEFAEEAEGGAGDGCAGLAVVADGSHAGPEAGDDFAG